MVWDRTAIGIRTGLELCSLVGNQGPRRHFVEIIREGHLEAQSDRPERPAPVPKLLLAGRRKITLARLHLERMVRCAQIDPAEAAIALLIRGVVANGVLAAHLVLQFFEDLWQRMLPVHAKYTASGFIRHPLQIRIRYAAKV